MLQGDTMMAIENKRRCFNNLFLGIPAPWNARGGIIKGDK